MAAVKYEFFVIFTVFTVITGQGTYISSPPLTCGDIKYLVDFHNDARQAIANGSVLGQPRGMDLQRMSWDNKLAQMATNWSKGMVFQHSENRYDPRWPYVGENMQYISTSDLNNKKIEWNRALLAWFNEYKVYTYRPQQPDIYTGHYTQMVWHDTRYFGCGVTLYINKNNWMTKFYVCNYGPSGNFLGEYPYLKYGSPIPEPDYYDIYEGQYVIPTYNCDKLCCDFNQCSKPYGPKCLA